MNLNELSKEIHETAVEHGWWEEDRKLPEILMLCVSELAEALEEYRRGRPMVWRQCGSTGVCPNSHDDICTMAECTNGKENYGKPEGIAVEVADCLIRILDWCGKEHVDIDKILRWKMEYNKTRPYRHGGKKC